MKPKPGKSKPKPLKSGRPPLLATSTVRPKGNSKATKNLISAHHNLHKARAKAVKQGNINLINELDEQLDHLGGLKAYQHASLTGQSADRGGDSSIILVKWLEELNVDTKEGGLGGGLRVLEVGALSCRNAISRVPCTASNGRLSIEYIKRIDLNSVEPGIEQVDFMDLGIPSSREKFDCLSLSLVLNYVPCAEGRGEMLRRTRDFLRLSEAHVSGDEGRQEKQKEGKGFPCLFVVLPLPCLANSRYLSVLRFRELMVALGYTSIRMHQSAKLHYELFVWDQVTRDSGQFKKLEVNPGKGRNNFCIVLDPTTGG